MNDVLEHVSIRPSRHGLKEITRHDLTALRQPFLGKIFLRSLHRMGEVEEDTVQLWMGFQNSEE